MIETAPGGLQNEVDKARAGMTLSCQLLRFDGEVDELCYRGPLHTTGL